VAGDDTLDGGSGSDTLNGARATTCSFIDLRKTRVPATCTGGSGIDTVRLMSRTPGLRMPCRPSWPATLHIWRGADESLGEVSNGSSRDFTFNFGSSTTLTGR
jgi:Ca2+-binding RTX toxin-like protein